MVQKERILLENRQFCLPFYKYTNQNYTRKYRERREKKKEDFGSLQSKQDSKMTGEKQLRQLAREDVVVVARLEPENSVQNDSYHLLRDAQLYLTATDRLRNVSVWIRWREFATEKMDPRLEIFRNEIEEKGLRVYHVENGLTE